MFKDYRNLKVKPRTDVTVLPRFSITSDIVSYRRCPRLYGYIKHKGFQPAQTTQIYYGTILHEVLDLTHHHYQGLENRETFGTVPNNHEIRTFFHEVNRKLVARGIKAVNRRQHDLIIRVLSNFNRIEGPTLYPRVIDTEHRIMSKRDEYIMEGIVDVLVGPEADINHPPQDPSEWEIWDYKGMQHPKDPEHLSIIQDQLIVYSALFRLRNGCLPKACKVYFLNELDVPGIQQRPSNAIYQVEISEDEISRALNDFDIISNEIILETEKNIWDPPTGFRLEIIGDTCAICDFRWGCKSHTANGRYPFRYP